MDALIEKRIIENLPNFRRVYPRNVYDDGNTFSGKIFRSSRLDKLSDEDAESLVRGGIRTIIDCRNIKEYLGLKANCKIDKHYPLYHSPEPFPFVKVKYVPNESVHLNQVPSRKQILQGNPVGKKHVCLNFFKMNYVFNVLIRAPFLVVLTSLLYLLKDLFDFSSNYHKHFVGFFAEKCFNPQGIIMQYKNILEWSQASICAALKILSDRESLPAIINCRHGKDRTGILVMIILSVVGVPRDEIVKDYSLSEEGLASIRDRVHYDLCVRYNMTEDFKGAKRETMEQLLDYIDKQYGSMEGYLDYIGFGPEERQRLRDNLTDSSGKTLMDID